MEIKAKSVSVSLIFMAVRVAIQIFLSLKRKKTKKYFTEDMLPDVLVQKTTSQGGTTSTITSVQILHYQRPVNNQQMLELVSRIKIKNRQIFLHNQNLDII